MCLVLGVNPVDKIETIWTPFMLVFRRSRIEAGSVRKNARERLQLHIIN